MAEKKTIDEWAAEMGIRVLDPDGFDRTDKNLRKKKFTRAEFTKGLWTSTIAGDPRQIGRAEKESGEEAQAWLTQGSRPKTNRSTK
jgi:hypothetical protein